MTTLNELLIKQHNVIFDMLAKALSSIPDKAISACSPNELKALRLVLHSLEAIDNYLSSNPPPNFGEYLKYGKRSFNQPDEFPSYQNVTAYLAEVQQRTQGYLVSLSDEQLLSTDNAWQWELFSLFFYVSNHTFVHLGHLDQLLYDSSDPRVWKCFSYNFVKK